MPSKHYTPFCRTGSNYKLFGGMRTKHDATNGYFSTVATKISLADKVRLNRIADGFNMTLYELLQALLLSIARYFDKGSVVTYEGNTLLNALGNIMFASADSFSPMALKNRQQYVSNAILFVQHKKGQRPQLIETHTDTQGNLIESYNYDGMLSAFLGCLDPDALKYLKDEAKRLGYFSITHTLHELILQRATPRADRISEEVNELFSDIRISTGQQTNEDIHFKRKKNTGEEYTTITQHSTYRADL